MYLQFGIELRCLRHSSQRTHTFGRRRHIRFESAQSNFLHYEKSFLRTAFHLGPRDKASRMWFYSFLRPVRLERLSKFYHLAVAGTRKSTFTMSYARCPQGDLICLIVSNVMQSIGLVFESLLAIFANYSRCIIS